MSGRAQTQGYKRSWKNLLINKSYQLKFTLMMVGIATLLMVGLGLWVMKVANETTEVSMASVRGTPCAIVPDLLPDPEDTAAPTPAPTPAPAMAPAPAPEAAPTPAPTPDEAAPADDDDEDGGHHKPKIVMTESTMEMVAPPPKVFTAPPDYAEKWAQHQACTMNIQVDINSLEAGRMRILAVLIATGLLLVVGLAFYGIKMTHKVAGPLFKVGLYLQKMRDGRFDKVWNLRKGDQLVDFYEHFKTGHAGVVTMQKDDIAKLKAVIAAAEAAGAGEHESVVQLRDIVARKEKALE